MRRLPIFFVVDVSESMVGEPIKKVEEGIRMIITELKKDPYALETAYVSILIFAGKAKTLVPLTDIISFYPPSLPIGAGTAYGEVMRHLMREIESQVRPTTNESKGDWKPVIYFLTDGNPTDDYRIDLGLWEQKWKDRSNAVVISIGDNCDHSILSRISDNILAFDDADADAYKQFFKWVTSSIKTQSIKVEEQQDDSLNLGGFDQAKLKKVTSKPMAEPSHDFDDRYAILHGKCQNHLDDYLIKYQRSTVDGQLQGIGKYQVQAYRLVGSYKLDKTYRELSAGENTQSASAISTEELWGVPNCPSCGNRFAMCICICGGIFCVDGPGVHTCPHCKQTSPYGAGDGHIDIGRQQG